MNRNRFVLSVVRFVHRLGSGVSATTTQRVEVVHVLQLGFPIVGEPQRLAGFDYATEEDGAGSSEMVGRFA